MDVVNVSTLYREINVKIRRREGSLNGFCHCWRMLAPSTPDETKRYRTAPASWHSAKPRNIDW